MSMVYVVTRIFWESTNTEAVYSNKEAADAHVDALLDTIEWPSWGTVAVWNYEVKDTFAGLED